MASQLRRKRRKRLTWAQPSICLEVVVVETTREREAEIRSIPCI
jgi:hypothetical protein